jgi:hypothetical protein
MSRTNNRVIGTLAAALVVAALVPGASMAYRPGSVGVHP